MQGIFINARRPVSKKEIKETVISAPDSVCIEATSMFGNDYDGPLNLAPDGEYYIVGPDPYTKRNFYATITKTGDKVKVS